MKYFLVYYDELCFSNRAALIPWDLLPDEEKKELLDIQSKCSNNKLWVPYVYNNDTMYPEKDENGNYKIPILDYCEENSILHKNIQKWYTVADDKPHEYCYIYGIDPWNDDVDIGKELESRMAKWHKKILTLWEIDSNPIFHNVSYDHLKNLKEYCGEEMECVGSFHICK